MNALDEKGIGRPSSYTDQKADMICERLSDGESLRSICSDDGMPDRGTVFRWLATNETFRSQYARAREAQADALADDILSIADDGKSDSYIDDKGQVRVDQDVIARSKLRVDARKWIASKLKPRVYGDKVTAELQGEGGGPVLFAKVVREIVDPKKEQS